MGRKLGFRECRLARQLARDYKREARELGLEGDEVIQYAKDALNEEFDGGAAMAVDWSAFFEAVIKFITLLMALFT